MGPMGKMMPTYRVKNALLTISGCGAVLTVFCLPEVDPYFEREKNTLGGVGIADTTTIFKNQPSP